MNPKISVIVPVYNADKWIEDCLTSIQNQSFQDFEVIIVDDGSIDQSGYICDQFASNDSRFRVIHKENSGVSESRNVALKLCVGDWVTFVDADDTLPVDSLRVRLESCLVNNTDVSVGNITEISSTGAHMYHSYPFEHSVLYLDKDVQNKFLQYAIFPNNFFGGCCNKLYKRSVIIGNNIYFTKRQRAEDWLFNIAFFEIANSVTILVESVYNYLRRENSAMSKPYNNQIELWRESLKKKKEIIEKYKLSIDERKFNVNILNEVIEYSVKLALQNRKENAKLAIKAFKFAKQNNAVRRIDFKSLTKIGKLLWPSIYCGLYAFSYRMLTILLELNRRRIKVL